MDATTEAASWIKALVTHTALASAQDNPVDARVYLLTAIRAAGNAYGALHGLGTGGLPNGHWERRVGDELEAQAQAMVADADNRAA